VRKGRLLTGGEGHGLPSTLELPLGAAGACDKQLVATWGVALDGAAFSSPAFSTHVIWCRVFQSCVFHACHLVLAMPVPHFSLLRFMHPRKISYKWMWFNCRHKMAALPVVWLSRKCFLYKRHSIQSLTYVPKCFYLMLSCALHCSGENSFEVKTEADSSDHRRLHTQENQYTCTQCEKRQRCAGIWIFIEVNTSAPNVADVGEVLVNWQYTGEVIHERNHLNVLFVANDSQHHPALFCTAEITVERNYTNVMSVAWHLLRVEI